jgi:AAA domain-containing protein
MALQIAVAVAQGKSVFDSYDSHQGRVTYLALEEAEALTHRRLHRMVGEAEVYLQNLDFIYRIPPLLAGGAELHDARLAEAPSRLSVIDTLLAVVQNRGSRDVLRSAEINVIRELAQKHKHSDSRCRPQPESERRLSR